LAANSLPHCLLFADSFFPFQALNKNSTLVGFNAALEAWLNKPGLDDFAWVGNETLLALPANQLF
jgi:hypothetical protein